LKSSRNTFAMSLTVSAPWGIAALVSLGIFLLSVQLSRSTIGSPSNDPKRNALEFTMGASLILGAIFFALTVMAPTFREVTTPAQRIGTILQVTGFATGLVFGFVTLVLSAVLSAVRHIEKPKNPKFARLVWTCGGITALGIAVMVMGVFLTPKH
jgi:hypothetical protein